MSAQEKKVIDLPAYWLVVLEKAVSAGDVVNGAEAYKQLRRLGIEVSLRKIAPQCAAEATDAG
jgi:hypothetical protein